MKQIQQFTKLNFFLFFVLLNTTTFGQYSETFSIANKGIIAGPCGATASTCAVNDFTGVNWDINGDLSGILNNDDFVKTDGTDLTYEDIDEEVCWESPLLDISTVGGNVSLSVEVAWIGHDNEDYIDVEYQINGGTWVQVSNVLGGGTHTIDFTTTNNNGSTTVTETGLSGTSTISIRVCGDINLGTIGGTTFESISIDNVSVPESGVTVVPVELTSFKAKKSNDFVELRWTTATETNNEKFEIEYSIDGRLFEKIGEVEGNGTHYETTQYSFNHESPSTGQNYYRLKQIDFDGRFEYSELVNVNFSPKENIVGEFYPNPSSSGIVQLNYFSSKESILTRSVYDSAGKFYSSQEIFVVEGKNVLDLDFSDLKTGLYFVKFEGDSELTYRKLIVN